MPGAVMQMPSLGEWALIGLGLALVGAAAFFLRAARRGPKRSRKPAPGEADKTGF